MSEVHLSRLFRLKTRDKCRLIGLPLHQASLDLYREKKIERSSKVAVWLQGFLAHTKQRPHRTLR